MRESEAFFIKNNKVYINIPIKNKGKFRWKNRKTINDYGEGFSTDKIPYSPESYIEWQIGYDVPVKDYLKDPTAKPTVLNDLIFTNLKGVEKHPYELSEFLVAMIEAKLVSEKEVAALLSEIAKSSTSLEDQFQIKTDSVGNYEADGIMFSQQNITLPTFVYCEKNGVSFVEISIQKQQYASGVQPMVYFSIPITSLEDGKDMIGKTAKQLNINQTYFVIDESNKGCILNMFKFFGICSSKHKHDISEILKLIDEYVKNINSKK